MSNRIATYYRMWPTQQEPAVRFVVLSKHPHRERYVFLWDDGDEGCRREVLRTAGRWASDSRLSFTWGDAAKLSSIVRSKG
jgi:hypothetical protein